MHATRIPVHNTDMVTVNGPVAPLEGNPMVRTLFEHGHVRISRFGPTRPLVDETSQGQGATSLLDKKRRCFAGIRSTLEIFHTHSLPVTLIAQGAENGRPYRIGKRPHRAVGKH